MTEPDQDTPDAPAWQDSDIVEGLGAFYVTVDQVIAGVTARTEFPCRRGCSLCCQDVPPPVSMSEWKVLLEHLRTLPRELVAPMLERALELHDRHREVLEAIEREPGRLDELARSIRYTCPFLVDDACSVYPARPHACRLYGHAYIPGHDKMYACSLVEDALLGQSPALVNLEQTLAMLRLYPGTDRSQLFPWLAAHHLPEDLVP